MTNTYIEKKVTHKLDQMKTRIAHLLERASGNPAYLLVLADLDSEPQYEGNLQIDKITEHWNTMTAKKEWKLLTNEQRANIVSMFIEKNSERITDDLKKTLAQHEEFVTLFESDELEYFSVDPDNNYTRNFDSLAEIIGQQTRFGFTCRAVQTFSQEHSEPIGLIKKSDKTEMLILQNDLLARLKKIARKMMEETITSTNEFPAGISKDFIFEFIYENGLSNLISKDEVDSLFLLIRNKTS